MSLSGEDDDIFKNTDVKKVFDWAQRKILTWRMISIPKGSHDYQTWLDDYRDEMIQTLEDCKRNSFASRKVVQGNEGKVSRVDWCQIDEVDISRPRASWQIELKTPETDTKGDGANGSPKGSHVQDEKAGVVDATYKNNVFNLKTSRVKQVTLYISPQMVNVKKPLVVYTDGEHKLVVPIKWDTELMKQMYRVNGDRKQIWIASIKVTIPG